MSNVPPPNPFSANPQGQPLQPVPVNPYEVSAQSAPMQGNSPEAIRKLYIAHEASVKSIGTLYFLGAGLLGLLTLIYIGMFVYALTSPKPEDKALAVVSIIAALFCGTFCILQGVGGVGLWQLKPWARILATVLSAIGLLGFPLGTLISAYFLYLLQSEKGKIVFSDSYKAIIQQTPHVKYRTSIIVWILLGLLVLFVVGILVLAAIGGRS